MTVINGHYDGQRVVLDEPVPAGIASPTPVKVVFGEVEGQGVLAEIERLARPGGKPPDFSQQHEFYIKGGPRR